MCSSLDLSFNKTYFIIFSFFHFHHMWFGLVYTQCLEIFEVSFYTRQYLFSTLCPGFTLFTITLKKI